MIADIAKLSGYSKIDYLDDKPNPNMPILGEVSSWKKYLDQSEFVIAIGNNETRERVSELLNGAGAAIATLVHPNAAVAADVKLGAGCVVMAGAVINVGSVLGSGVIVNTGSSIDHDCIIGPYVHVSVGSHIAGTTAVGARTFIGAGATVINNISVCSDCMIGAGATVIKDIKTPGTYVGVPVRRVLL